MNIIFLLLTLFIASSSNASYLEEWKKIGQRELKLNGAYRLYKSSRAILGCYKNMKDIEQAREERKNLEVIELDICTYDVKTNTYSLKQQEINRIQQEIQGRYLITLQNCQHDAATAEVLAEIDDRITTEIKRTLQRVSQKTPDELLEDYDNEIKDVRNRHLAFLYETFALAIFHGAIPEHAQNTLNAMHSGLVIREKLTR